MVNLTRHDQRLLSGACAFMTAIVGSGAAGSEIMDVLEKTNKRNAQGVAMAIGLFSVLDPDMDIAEDTELDWQNKEQLAERFVNNMARLKELGAKFLDEDKKEFGI